MTKLGGLFLVGLSTLAIDIILFPSDSSRANYASPQKQSPSTRPQFQNRSDEILNVLMPNGVWGDASQLNHFARAEEIQVLRRAQLEAKSGRALGIAFLLAALGEDYKANRRVLLDALNACGKMSYPDEGACTDFVVDYLMELCRRGDNSLLHTIFNASEKADGAFSQALGAFYSDMLQKRPNQFLAALARYPKKRQRDFCWRAGVEDGSGMDQERFRSVRLLLKNIAARSGSPLSPIARNCLSHLRDGYNDASQNAKSLGVR